MKSDTIKVFIFLFLCVCIGLLYINTKYIKESFNEKTLVKRKTDCVRDMMYNGYAKCSSKYPSVLIDLQSLTANDFLIPKKLDEEPANRCTSDSCPYLPTGNWSQPYASD